MKNSNTNFFSSFVDKLAACVTATLPLMVLSFDNWPAAAATFTYTGPFMEEWRIEYGDSETTELTQDSEQWTSVQYGDLSLDYVGVPWQWERFADSGDFYRATVRNDIVGLYRGNIYVSVLIVPVRFSEFALSDREQVPEPSAAIALSMLGLGAVASRLRRRS